MERYYLRNVKCCHELVDSINGTVVEETYNFLYALNLLQEYNKKER